MHYYSKRFKRFVFQYEWLGDAPDWACMVFLGLHKYIHHAKWVINNEHY